MPVEPATAWAARVLDVEPATPSCSPGSTPMVGSFIRLSTTHPGRQTQPCCSERPITIIADRTQFDHAGAPVNPSKSRDRTGEVKTPPVRSPSPAMTRFLTFARPAFASRGPDNRHDEPVLIPPIAWRFGWSDAPPRSVIHRGDTASNTRLRLYRDNARGRLPWRGNP
jgi:hypothetical protein